MEYDEEKVKNFKKLIALQNEMGFKLLNNASEIIKLNQSTIDLLELKIGVVALSKKGI